MNFHVLLWCVKSIIAFALLTILFLQLGFRLGLISSFELNKDYVKKYLCVNRNNIQSSCEGQCYLMKQIQEQENQTTDVILENLLKIEPQLPEFSIFIEDQKQYLSFETAFLLPIYQNICSGFKFSLLKPPRF